MSHFRFPRTTRPIEQEMLDTVNNIDHSLNEEDNTSVHSNMTTSSNNSAHSNSSSDSSTILASRPLPHTHMTAASERRCWICFGDNSDSQGKWVKPCQCSLEAHQSCLLDWIAENQKASPTKTVRCPQCSAEYHLAQRNSITLALLTLMDSLVRTSAPYITVLGVGCSILITCTTYGAYSIMVMFGQKEGERLIGNPNSWTWKTWIGLPLIPITLISTKTRWGDFILPVAAASFIRAIGYRPEGGWFRSSVSPAALTFGVIPWICVFYRNAYTLTQRYITRSLSLQEPSIITNSANSNIFSRRRSSISGEENISDRERNLELEMINGRGGSIGLSLISALLWPTFSSLIGGLLYKSKWIRHYFPETFQRNVLGGCLFVVAKDIGNLIYKYERIRQYRSRRVKSYDEVQQARQRYHRR
ncbi:hypothetical protein CU097_006149 [Rhizopus azygosporus]|uniref:RING-CH-type domain-containing protein n=1 Tax=Rhizopus azygosporus TaxID=86630 RepID=A0A367K536_RHIAZ|nr:hypothetical protein CU097_006149 [Rhizopus azygosporus]